MPEPVMTWEADEVRAGTRRIPGYAGHLPGLRHTLSTTFGNCSAEVLSGGDTDALKFFTSSIIRNRKDGFTTPGHPDYPFKEEIFRTNYNPPIRIIAGYKGHEPGWCRTYGTSTGRYGNQNYKDFTTITRKMSKSLRVPTKPETIMALPDPVKGMPREDLYPRERYYIPGTTYYAPAIRERFGSNFSSLTLAGFEKPTPKILDPLTRRADGPRLDVFQMIPGYAGFCPRVVPELYHRVEELAPGSFAL